MRTNIVLNDELIGALPDWVETRLAEGTPTQLEQWAEQVLDAETLEAVFRE